MVMGGVEALRIVVAEEEADLKRIIAEKRIANEKRIEENRIKVTYKRFDSAVTDEDDGERYDTSLLFGHQPEEGVKQLFNQHRATTNVKGINQQPQSNHEFSGCSWNPKPTQQKIPSYNKNKRFDSAVTDEDDEGRYDTSLLFGHQPVEGVKQLFRGAGN